MTDDTVKIDEPHPATLKRCAAIPPSENTFLRVVTKARQQYEGSGNKIAELGMTLVKRGKTVHIPKNDVAQVYYVR